MSADPPALGKGLFGYRKSAVNQMLSDRDVMLRQAEGRVRAAESKVAQLEGELTSMRDRNAKVEEQLDRLREQLNALAAQAPTATVATGPAPAETWGTAPPAIEHAAEAYAPSEEAALYPEAEQPSPYWEIPEPAVQEQPPMDEPPVSPAAAWETGPEATDWHIEETVAGASTESEAPEARPAPLASEEEPPAHEPTPPPLLGTDGGPQPEPPPTKTAPTPVDPWDYPAGYDADAFGYHSARRREREAAQELAESLERTTPPDAASQPSDAYDVAPESAALDQEVFQADESWEATAAEGEEMAVEPEVPHMEGYHEAGERPAIEREEERRVAPTGATPHHPPGEEASRFVTEELAGILSAAEESASRIIERARVSSEQQIDRATKLWNEVQAEVTRFASWRDEVEPVIRTVQSKVENVRAYIEEVPERIREALAPMAESISSIDSDLAELSAACSPPILLTPTEFDRRSEGRQSPENRPPEPEATSEQRSPQDPFGPHTFGSSAG